MGYPPFWVGYLSEFFWRHYWDDGTPFQNNSEFLVCLSVCLSAYFLTKLRQRDISSSGWDIFLKVFGDILKMLVHWFQIILNFLYKCQSISWLTSLLRLEVFKGVSSSGWDIFLKFFGDNPWMLVHYIQIILNFVYVCLSVSWLTSLLKTRPK